MRPFDLLEALKGGNVVTRNGDRVILTNYVIGNPFPLRGAIIVDSDPLFDIQKSRWNDIGRYYNNDFCSTDLFMKED